MVTENIRLFYPYVTIHYWSNKIHAEKKVSDNLSFHAVFSNAGHKTILGPKAQGWVCVQVGL